MATPVEVKCINKSNRFSAHERILHIGGIGADGVRWRLTQEAAMAGIERGERSFYVSRGGSTVSVVVATSAYGNKYLKTVVDGEQPDNLLSLPECP